MFGIKAAVSHRDRFWHVGLLCCTVSTAVYPCQEILSKNKQKQRMVEWLKVQHSSVRWLTRSANVTHSMSQLNVQLPNLSQNFHMSRNGVSWFSTHVHEGLSAEHELARRAWALILEMGLVSDLRIRDLECRMGDMLLLIISTSKYYCFH